MARVIEFMGMPGSGKTTIARALAAHLESTGTPTISVREYIDRPDGQLARVLKSLHPSIFSWHLLTANFGLAAHRRAALTKFCKRAMAICTMREWVWKLHHNEANKIIVLEEFIVNYVEQTLSKRCNQYDNAKVRSSFCEFYRGIDVMLVYVKTDPLTVSCRMDYRCSISEVYRERQYDAMESHLRLPELKTLEHLYDMLWAAAHSAFAPSAMILDGSVSVDDNVKLIQNAISHRANSK